MDQKLKNLAGLEAGLSALEMGGVTSSTPKSTVLEITGRCIGNCRACYTCSNRSIPDMPEGEAFQAVDIMARLGYEEVYVTGGEPMLNPGLALAVCEYAQSKGLRTILVTSGYGLDSPDLAREALRVTDRIEFSVRSHDPAVHDRIISGYLPDDPKVISDSIPGNFDAVLKAMKTVHDLKMEMESAAEITVNHDAYPGSSLYSIVRLLTDRGIRIDGIFVQLISLTGKTRREADILKESYFIPGERLRKIFDEILQIQKDFGIAAGFTDNPVNHEETDITSKNELPAEILPLIGDDIPAIAPDFMVRPNVTRLDRGAGSPEH